MKLFLFSIVLVLITSSSAQAETLNAELPRNPKLYGYRIEGTVGRVRLAPLYAPPMFVFGKTYFVRNDGSPNCNGLVNAPYPGSGTNQPCAFSSVQQAINLATFGDTIMLRAGETFDTPGVFNSFNLTDKGTPPTGAASDFITITTDDPSGTPLAISRYPHEDTRITTEMAARMPRVRTVGSYPAFWINKNSKFWRIKGLNITSVVGANSIRLIGLGEDDPKGRAEFPDHIDIEDNWIHPPEEVGEPLSASNIKRSAQNAIYLEGTNIRIRRNAMQGFVGRDADGGTLTSAGHLMTTWADNVLVENNLIEAWTYSVFYGGGSKGIADPNAVATVSNCTATSCVFSNVNGLTVGKPVAVFVYSFVDSIAIVREVWGTAFVASIDGSTVNFEKPLCNSNNTGGGGNVCKPFDSNNLRQIPANGNQARWEGYQVQNVLVRRNILAHRPEWATQMGNNCGGKGYLELKSCHNCTFDGNIFKGCTGPTITARNQGGPDPWNDLDNLTLSNNWFQNANSPFTAYLNDDGNLTSRTRNVAYINNLVVGEYADPNDFNWFRVISNNFAGGDGVRIEHNTVLVGRSRSYIASGGPRSSTLNHINRNNIYRMGHNICFINGDQGAPMPVCWPNADVSKNVFMNIDGIYTNAEINERWMDSYPDNTLVNSLAAVGFVNAPPTLDATGDYRLRADSPFKGKASDGKDPGVDMDQLNAAIFGSAPPPLPGPTPTITPTPVPSPTVQPTPLPSPSPQPTATPSPAPTPTPAPPAGQIILSGKTFSALDGGPFPWTTVVLSDATGKEIRRLQEQDNSYSFTVLPGSYQIHIEQGGYNVSPGRIYVTNATENTGGLSALNFTVGLDTWFKAGPVQCVPSGSQCPPGAPSPSPTPVSSPSPVPTVSPTPLPSPTSTPSPSPSVPLPSPSPSPSVPQPSPGPTPPASSPTPTPAPIPSPTPELPRVESRTLSSDLAARTRQVNDIERNEGLKLINCDARVCYFARRP